MVDSLSISLDLFFSISLYYTWSYCGSMKSAYGWVCQQADRRRALKMASRLEYTALRRARQRAARGAGVTEDRARPQLHPATVARQQKHDIDAMVDGVSRRLQPTTTPPESLPSSHHHAGGGDITMLEFAGGTRTSVAWRLDRS